jgi:hypothetical protein
MKVLCDVYKSSKKSEMYLYVKRDDALERVPEALIELFGKAEKTMTMVVTADKKFAQFTGERLLEVLDEKGFYLQMPPAMDEEVAAIVAQNNRLNH